MFSVFVVDYWCIYDLQSRFLKNRLRFSFFQHFIDCKRNRVRFFYQFRGFLILIILFTRYCSLFFGFFGRLMVSLRFEVTVSQ
ncbi:hypothetical protein AMTRI_Chr06g198900 [Amborella trichopoda]